MKFHIIHISFAVLLQFAGKIYENAVTFSRLKLSIRLFNQVCITGGIFGAFVFIRRIRWLSYQGFISALKEYRHKIYWIFCIIQYVLYWLIQKAWPVFEVMLVGMVFSFSE